MEQITNRLLMIRPTSFRANELTAKDNYFQGTIDASSEELLSSAQDEFDAFVQKLRMAGVEVTVVDAQKEVDVPDAHFPNNWISFHENGTVALYPMLAENRRLERNEEVLTHLEDSGFVIHDIVDYSSAEEESVFLEGTGSMILDRVSRKAYAALSQRTHEELFIEFCEDFEFTPVIFHANQEVDGTLLPIYHTNVMMCVGDAFAVICSASITDKKERKSVLKHLREDGKEIVDISLAQMNAFAGNMLQVKGSDNKSYIVMSLAAYSSLGDSQIAALKKHATPLYSDLHTIETCGGGSARCMMAEVFLPVN